MMQLITPAQYVEFADSIREMHRMRYRVFKERLDWDVQIINDMEIDKYDRMDPIYLLQRGFDGKVQGCVRLLPTNGPNMLRDRFSALLGGNPCPSDPEIWESSRFALELTPALSRSEGGLAMATYELFAGMIEFGLSRSLNEIITVTDVRIERILKRAHWPLKRLGNPMTIGTTIAVAGSLEVSAEALARVNKVGGIYARVLWMPVPLVMPVFAHDADR